MAYLFRADPYRIAVLNQDGSEGELSEVLNDVFTLPSEPFGAEGTRWGSNATNYIQIANLQPKKHQGASALEGTAYQSRTRDLHTVSGPSGEKDLPLVEEEGLGKHVGFLYDVEEQTLWFQRDRNVLTVGQFLDYLMDKSERSITHTPRFGGDVVKRALKAKKLKSILIKLEESSNARQKFDEAPTLSQFWRWNRQQGGAKITVIIQPAHGKDLAGTSTNLVKEAVAMYQEQAPELAAARFVRRKNNDDDTNPLIDLLNDRAFFATKLKEDRFRRPGPLMDVIRFIWKTHRTSLT